MEDALARYSHNHGLWSLPRETLIRIVEYVGAEKDGYERCEANKAIRSLSLVSKDFSELVADTLKLWTTLDRAYCSPTGFETRIARTKNAPLTLKLESWRIESDKSARTLSNTFSVIDRYRRLEMRFSHVEDILEFYPVLNFPKAEEAVMRFCGVEREWQKLFQSWTFPKIRKLGIINAIPHPGLFTQLTRLKLKMQDIETPGLAFDILYRLPRFLAHLERLETLSLECRGTIDPDIRRIVFGGVEESEPPMPDETNFPVTHLPTVKSFYLTNYSKDCGRDSFFARVLVSLFETIRIPSVRDVSIRVAFRYDEDMVECLEPFADHDVANNVSHASVASWVHLDLGFLVRFLDRFANVQSFNTEISSFISGTTDLDDDLSDLENLQLLTVHGKPAFHTEVVDDCVDRFDKQATVHSGTEASIEYLDEYELDV